MRMGGTAAARLAGDLLLHSRGGKMNLPNFSYTWDLNGNRQERQTACSKA